MLRHGIPASWLGGYGLTDHTPDPRDAKLLKEAVDLVLSWPGLDTAEMRIMLAEARGDKFPDDYRGLARLYQRIGIGRRQSYNLAAIHCRPTDSRPSDSPPPGGGPADAES